MYIAWACFRNVMGTFSVDGIYQMRAYSLETPCLTYENWFDTAILWIANKSQKLKSILACRR